MEKAKKRARALMHRSFNNKIQFFNPKVILASLTLWNLLCSPSTFAAGDKNTLGHCLIQGKIQYDNSRYDKAIEWWEKALEADPDNKEALKYIDRARERLGMRASLDSARSQAQEKAVNEIPAGLSKIKKQASNFIIEGKKYYSKQQYNWAISEWKKALKVDPGNVEAAGYIEKAEARIKQKPSERKPIEAEMMPAPPAPEFPPPVFEKPTKDMFLLEDAVNVGIKNHLPIQIALEQMKLARFKEKEAFRELFPQATIRWDESRGIVTSKDYIGRKYQLRVQHPLYHGGEMRYTWEQAKVNLKISKENYDKTREDYINELTRAYYDLAKTMRNFKVQEKLFKDLEQDLAMAKKEHDAGLTTLVEFLNVQSQYNQSYYAYLSSENTLALAKSNFLQLLNLDNNPSININIDTELSFKEYNIDMEKCISIAYENRSDLKINELGLKAAELGEKVTRSQQLPKIDLTGNIGRSGEVFTPGKVQMSDDWFLGARVSVPWGPNTLNYSLTDENIAPSLTVYGPTRNVVNSVRFNILDNLEGYTEAQRSEVIREQAYSDLLKGKQTAATQVREAYFNYQESALKVKNSLANKELYQKELAIMKEKRLMNEAQTQDIVSSKVKLAGEEINYNAALVENILAVEKLNKAMGIRNYFK